MCQLLGMSCNTPTDICFSFTGFQARGGLTDVHRDGWGIAFFEGKGVRQFLDHEASAQSKVAELVKSYPIKSKNVVAHIRKATQGVVALENTHPFVRELWGYYWIFAHNGDIKNFSPELNGSFVPVGNTDSEKVFCWFMQELRERHGNSYPGDVEVFESLTELTCEVGGHGEFNFLLSNGRMLWAHCSTRLAYIVRQAPFTKARLKDQDVTVDFSHLTTLRDRVAVVATIPLTDDEVWIPLVPGTLCAFEDGDIIQSTATVAGPVKICTT